MPSLKIFNGKKKTKKNRDQRDPSSVDIEFSPVPSAAEENDLPVHDSLPDENEDEESDLVETSELPADSPDTSVAYQNALLFLWAIMFGVLIALTFVLIVKAGVLLFIPLIMILAVALLLIRRTVPPRDSFNSKKEIKRIKRGKNLPDGHQGKPKSWLNKKVTNVKSFISTETADAVGGYDVQFLDVGFTTVVTARDLTNGEYFSWWGIFGEWRVLNWSTERRALIHQWLSTPTR